MVLIWHCNSLDDQIVACHRLILEQARSQNFQKGGAWQNWAALYWVWGRTPLGDFKDKKTLAIRTTYKGITLTKAITHAPVQPVRTCAIEHQCDKRNCNATCESMLGQKQTERKLISLILMFISYSYNIICIFNRKLSKPLHLKGGSSGSLCSPPAYGPAWA